MCEWQNPECRVEDNVTDEADAPQRRMINPRDDDLPCREFQQLSKRTFAVGRNEAFRNKDDLCAITLRCACDGVIVTDRAAPGFENFEAVKCFPVDRCGP